MAPEVVNGKGHSYAADWWSFGILMYEMLIGQTPFDGKDKKHTKNKILSTNVKVPKWICTDGRQLLYGLLQKNPSHRIGIYRVQDTSILLSKVFFFLQILQINNTIISL